MAGNDGIDTVLFRALRLRSGQAPLRNSLLLFCLVLLSQGTPAQEYKDFGKDRLNSSPRHGEWVDIKSGERTIKAFVVYPERKDKAPAVLVVQEIFGLTDWLRSLCDELAENFLKIGRASCRERV